MFAKLARHITRRSTDRRLPLSPESTQDATDSEIVHQFQQPPREVVEIAPDHRWCNLDTPFPSVAFGGYIKYYSTKSAATANSTNPPNRNPLFNLTPHPPSLSHRILPHVSVISLPATLPDPTKAVQEVKHPRPSRIARRYSIANYSFSNSEKTLQRLRWRRGTCIIPSTITEHPLSPIVSRPPSLDTSDRHSLSKDSSDSSVPDSIAVEFRQTTADSESTDSPSSVYSDEDAADDFIMVESKGSDVRSRVESDCSSSYLTAGSAQSQE